MRFPGFAAICLEISMTGNDGIPVKGVLELGANADG